jgi:hypothetical protein
MRGGRLENASSCLLDQPAKDRPAITDRAVEAPTAPAVSEEQLRALAWARQQSRRISRAALVAGISGWTLAVFSLLTLLGGLFSLPSLLLGVGLAAVAYRELRGSKGLRAMDPAAPGRLGVNQLVLGAMILAYAAWGMAQALTAASPYESYLQAGGPVAESLAPIDRLHRMVTFAFYAAVICVSVVAQGSLAAYYFTRRRHVLDFLRETPAWIVDMLRVAAA